MRIERIGQATMYLADYREVLPSIAADAAVTDQPYGTGWIRGGGKKAGEFKRRKETAEWDVFDLTWMDHAPSVMAAFCPIQGVWDMCQRLKTPCVLKYRKSNPAPYGAPVEPIVVSHAIKGPWEMEFYNGSNDLHPCQKPIPLMAWLIDSLTAENMTVVDPFMGSGTTGVAAVQLRRNFIGIEINEAYFNIACQRLENAQRQERMFA